MTAEPAEILHRSPQTKHLGSAAEAPKRGPAVPPLEPLDVGFDLGGMDFSAIEQRVMGQVQDMMLPQTGMRVDRTSFGSSMAEMMNSPRMQEAMRIFSEGMAQSGREMAQQMENMLIYGQPDNPTAVRDLGNEPEVPEYRRGPAASLSPGILDAATFAHRTRGTQPVVVIPMEMSETDVRERLREYGVEVIRSPLMEPGRTMLVDPSALGPDLSDMSWRDTHASDRMVVVDSLPAMQDAYDVHMNGAFVGRATLTLPSDAPAGTEIRILNDSLETINVRRTAAMIEGGLRAAERYSIYAEMDAGHEIVLRATLDDVKCCSPLVEREETEKPWQWHRHKHWKAAKARRQGKGKSRRRR